MHKRPLTIFLLILFALPSMAQQPPFRKLYADPHQPGMLIDSSQFKRYAIRDERILKEIIRIKDSIRSTQNSASRNSTTISRIFATLPRTSLSNNCGVKASFSPGNDTTLYTGQDITFTNTSQNADSYEWIVDVYNHYYTTDYQFVPSIGVTQVLLVAHQGNCTDTAVTYVVRNGTAPADEKRMSISYGIPAIEEWASCMTAAKADGYLLAGVSGISTRNGYTRPYFVRVSESGCILWSRLLPQYSNTTLRSLITTYDSGFVLQVVLADDINNSYLLKLDKNGNLVWAHSYNGDNALSWVGSIKEMSDHSLMVLNGQWSGHDFLLTKLDESGNFLWQKKYLVNDADYASFTDLVEKNGFAYLSGSYNQLLDISTNSWKTFPMLFKVDASNGNLQWSRGYSSPNKYYASSEIHFFKDGLILNGFADSLVNAPNNQWNNFQSLLETDIDGNIRDGKSIYNPFNLDIPGANNLVMNADNSMSIFYSGTQLTSLQPGYVNENYILRMDAGKNILWQQTYTGYLVQGLMQLAPAPSKGLALAGQIWSSLLSPSYGFGEKLLLLKLDSNGTAADPFCGIYLTGSTLQDLAVTDYSPGTPVTTDETLQVADQPVSETSPNSELRYNCPYYVPLCSFMKLSGKDFVCNMKDTIDFIAHKDPSCADPVKWTYDVSNIKTVYEDGGKTRLLFNAPGTYKIRAEKPFPCTPITDSIMVTVAAALIDFGLGNDTTLCAGDSITIRPKGKYDQYLWQDFSTADSMKVKMAGDYHLMVTDSCGNTKSDTIHIDFKSSIPLDLGVTRLKCLSDSLTIIPPAGYKQYNWAPLYRMLVSADGSVVLFPDKDTTYRLIVQDGGGCTGTADLKILNYPANKVYAGRDTTICTGSDVLFNATGNFVSYSWNDGETTPSIDVQLAGIYIVQTIDGNNCKSADTVTLAVFPVQQVQITGAGVLCKDQVLILDAGAGFSDYLWQDGSRNQLFNATDTGFYRVTTTDIHHCVSADSVHIVAYAESPMKFLPADTTVCLYYGAVIQPKGDFVIYNWSTGETSRAIHVKTAGDYILNVVDLQGCRGADSIHIDTKDCEALLVFPNAFTPNHDGVNDVFRLKFPGIVSDYQLQIFNRWGQLIYRSSDPFGQWDGTFSGEAQPGGNYIWTVHFTDRTGKKQQLSGSVLLIR